MTNERLLRALTAALGWTFWGLCWLLAICLMVLVLAHFALPMWLLWLTVPGILVDWWVNRDPKPGRGKDYWRGRHRSERR